MNKIINLLTTSFLLLFTINIDVWAQANKLQTIPDLPIVDRYLVDNAGVLSTAQQDSLSSQLFEFAEKHGSQVVIVIIDSTKPENIEQYSIRLAQSIGIGRKTLDDGVLILVAAVDRQVRIEVGYGLEGAIPDLEAKNIIEQNIIPNFKTQDYYTGLQQTVDNIFQKILAENLSPPTQEASLQENNNVRNNLAAIIFVAMFIIAMIKINKKVKIPVAIALGIIGNLIYNGWSIDSILVGAFIGFFLSVIGWKGFLAICIALISILTILGAASRSGRRFRRHGASGFSRGGGSFGGGVGSSGFRGGGGSFGGGGASGRW